MSRSYPPRVGPNMSIGDPALAEYLGWGGGQNDSGESVTETTSLGVTAVYRAVNIIASTVAGLPLKSYRDGKDGRVEVRSVWDDPGAGVFTPYEFVHVCMVHLCLHGNAFLWHVTTEGGAVAGFFPVHPSLVSVRFEDGKRRFKFSIPNDPEQYDLDETEMTQVMLFSTDGVTGSSPIDLARNAIGTSIAGDRAAARVFASGMMVGGIVTPDEDMTEEDARVVKAGLDAKMSGTLNAGKLAFVNRNLKISPWSMTMEDAQFIESRTHQVTEVARIFGIPKVLLAEDGASTWGSGIAELDRGMAKYTLRAYTTPYEQRASTVTRGSSFVEFDYKGLLQGTPKEELELLIMQKDAGILTLNEVRAIMNLPALPEAPPATGGTELGQPPADTAQEEI